MWKSFLQSQYSGTINSDGTTSVGLQHGGVEEFKGVSWFLECCWKLLLKTDLHYFWGLQSIYLFNGNSGIQSVICWGRPWGSSGVWAVWDCNKTGNWWMRLCGNGQGMGDGGRDHWQWRKGLTSRGLDSKRAWWRRGLAKIKRAQMRDLVVRSGLGYMRGRSGQHKAAVQDCLLHFKLNVYIT